MTYRAHAVSLPAIATVGNRREVGRSPHPGALQRKISLRRIPKKEIDKDEHDGRGECGQHRGDRTVRNEHGCLDVSV